jgi:hypothetical protein
VKLPIIGILSGVALATLRISGAAQAFQLIPSGLSPGNQYRLVFVTDGTIQATSTDINTYNTFVDNEAHTSTILNDAFTNVGIDPASITWKVIGSTASVNAIDNTSTNTGDTSAPIYGLDGKLIAFGNSDLWDGEICPHLPAAGIICHDGGISISQSGRYLFGAEVWTGTLSSGVAWSEPNLGPLGSVPVTIGSSYGTNVTWIRFMSDFGPGFNGPVAFRRLYGISGILTVPAPTATTTTPEPSSLLGFITLGGLMLGDAVRKARK